MNTKTSKERPSWMTLIVAGFLFTFISIGNVAAQDTTSVDVDDEGTTITTTDSSTSETDRVRVRERDDADVQVNIDNDDDNDQIGQPNETLSGGRAAIKNTFGIGPRVGFYRSYDATNGAFYFGLQARARLSPYFGLEGAADYRGKEEFAFGEDTLNRSADVSYVPLTASAVIFLPVSFNFVPYLVGGVGWYHTVVNYSNDPNRVDAVTSNDFGYHFGLGLELPLSEHASLGGDYRWIFLDTNFDASNPSTLDPENSNGYVITGSLMFYF